MNGNLTFMDEQAAWRLALTRSGHFGIHICMIELRTVEKSIVEALGTGTISASSQQVVYIARSK